jgi:hypothetical protein
MALIKTTPVHIFATYTATSGVVTLVELATTSVANLVDFKATNVFASDTANFVERTASCTLATNIFTPNSLTTCVVNFVEGSTSYTLSTNLLTTNTATASLPSSHRPR